MKLIRLCILFLMLSFWACSNNNIQIQFCTELTNEEACAVSQDTFPAYQRVYFSCQSKAAFPTGAIKGTIYHLGDGSKKTFIAEHIFQVESDTKYLNYYIPFEMYGGYGIYQVEISDPEGTLLAEDQLYIDAR